MSTHNLCFEQKYDKYQNFLSENFHFLLIKFSVQLHLNRRVFLMVVEKENKAVNSQRVNWNNGDQEAHRQNLAELLNGLEVSSASFNTLHAG